MLKNYIKIAWRNLVKNKSYSFINLTGLTISLAVFLVIGLYITNELSFDQHFSDVQNIVRVIQEDTKKNQPAFASVPPGLGTALKDVFPEVEAITELSLPNKRLLTVDNSPFSVKNIISVDAGFFDVFSFKILRGNVKETLKEPGQIILTESLAERLFNNENPIGQSITYENRENLTVAAVIADPPVNTHFSFDALKSLSAAELNDRSQDIRWQFFNSGFIYVKLKEGTSVAAFEKKLQDYEKTREKPEWMKGELNLAVQPITSVHLGAQLGNEIAPQGNLSYLYLFGTIGLIILALACVNYMNLSSAKSLQRFREVGVRKTFGANKKQLMSQFLSESVLICLLTLPLAFVITEAVLPYINQLLGLRFSLSGSQYLPLMLSLPLVVMATGILSGSYPAFYLATLKPGNALSKNQGRTKESVVRRSLVVFQFVTGILLIISTVTIYSQLDFVRNKSLGFDKEHVITFSTAYLGENYSTFKQKLENESSVLSVTSGPPAGVGHKNFTTSVKDPITMEEVQVSGISADYDYVETLGLKLKNGRLFSRDYPTDSENTILLTEEAARALNFDEASVGEYITFTGEEKQVIGILEDYHNATLFSKIQPVVIMLKPGNNWTGMVRLAEGNTQAGLNAVKEAWNAALPGRPFEFTFLDEWINSRYQKDQKLAALFSGFTTIALLIACLGLFGLAAFSAQQRTKEIGIRKVLGASVINIVSLLSKDFVKLVLIGFVLAAPVAWYAMNRWLADFAYRIEIGPEVFLGTGILALGIALLTVSWQSIKAALANPVDSLRSE